MEAKETRETLERQLRTLRAIQTAQARAVEIVQGIVDGDETALSELSAEAKSTVMNLQLRRLTPEMRSAITADIAALEEEMQRLTR